MSVLVETGKLTKKKEQLQAEIAVCGVVVYYLSGRVSVPQLR